MSTKVIGPRKVVDFGSARSRSERRRKHFYGDFQNHNGVLNDQVQIEVSRHAAWVGVHMEKLVRLGKRSVNLRGTR